MFAHTIRHRLPSVSGRRWASAASRRAEADLVGPNDPTSHIRPVIYASLSKAPSSSSSPYSSSEFAPGQSSGWTLAGETQDRLTGAEIEYGLKMERIDRGNHEFWATTNVLFQKHLDARLATLPDPSNEAAREQVLADFYRDWVDGNRRRQRQWVTQWWSDVRSVITMGWRRDWRRWMGQRS